MTTVMAMTKVMKAITSAAIRYTEICLQPCCEQIKVDKKTQPRLRFFTSVDRRCRLLRRCWCGCCLAAVGEHEQGGAIAVDSKLRPPRRDTDAAQIAAPEYAGVGFALQIFSMHQQDLAAKFTSQRRDALACFGEAIALPAQQERALTWLRQRIAVGEQHDASHLPLRGEGEQALQPILVGDQAVFEFAVAAAVGQEVIVCGRQVDRRKQNVAELPACVLRIAAKLRCHRLAEQRHLAGAE